MQETAFAKLNLALHVRGREADGYHRIETLFAFCEDGDLIEAAPAGELTLETTGPFADALGAAADNLVLRAAEALRTRLDVVEGAAIRLDKRLPVAAGIGGGSADAAAMLRLLPRLWGVDAAPETLHEIASSLGADVPACLDSRTARGEGRGERLRPVESGFGGTPALLVNPGIPLATSKVFAGWDGVDRGPLPLNANLETLWAARNDLEAPAQALVPEIRPLLDRLAASPGALLARMSGSGATCFALFGTAADRDAAAAGIAAALPGAWICPTRLR